MIFRSRDIQASYRGAKGRYSQGHWNYSLWLRPPSISWYCSRYTVETKLIPQGTILELQKGDILGHEFCGVIETVGPSITNLKPGQRVVCSFQIACGECVYCKQKLSSQCERTNDNSIGNAMYGGRTAGMLGYSHCE